MKVVLAVTFVVVGVILLVKTASQNTLEFPMTRMKWIGQVVGFALILLGAMIIGDVLHLGNQ